MVSEYDPKKYGVKNIGKKIEIMPHQEIIGVYGTQPNVSSTIFSSLGLVVMSKQHLN